MDTKPTKKIGRPPATEPVIKPNLAATWRDINASDKSLKEALTKLNNVLGMKVTHSRLSEWEQDRKTPSPAVIDYMLNDTLKVLLKQHSGSTEDTESIIKKLRIPGL